MTHAARMIVALSTLSAFTGCARERRADSAATGGDEQAALLTPEEAKRALLNMGDRQASAGIMVPPPNDEPIEVVSEGKIKVGIYECNLKEKTFHAAALYPNAPRHKVNELSGVFERGADGKWTVKVTRAMSAD